jgi:hypothetical protein
VPPIIGWLQPSQGGLQQLPGACVNWLRRAMESPCMLRLTLILLQAGWSLDKPPGGASLRVVRFATHGFCFAEPAWSGPPRGLRIPSEPKDALLIAVAIPAGLSAPLALLCLPAPSYRPDDHSTLIYGHPTVILRSSGHGIPGDCAVPLTVLQPAGINPAGVRFRGSEGVGERAWSWHSLRSIVPVLSAACPKVIRASCDVNQCQQVIACRIGADGVSCCCCCCGSHDRSCGLWSWCRSAVFARRTLAAEMMQKARH